jgi:sodium transport system permease protein
MLTAIGTIFRKELVDTLRDRRTLLFLLVIPTIVTPLLMVGLTRMMQAIAQAEQVKVVTIVASEDSQREYKRMVHDWFVRSEMGKSLAMLDQPLLRALVKPEFVSQFTGVPDGVTRDPEVFASWAKQLAEQARDNIDAPEERAATTEMPELSQEKLDLVVDFYVVAIKGLGLVEFVTPDELPPVSPDFKVPYVPEAGKDLPLLSAIAEGISERRIHGYLDFPVGVDAVKDDDIATIDLMLLHESTVSLSREAASRFRQVVDRVSGALVKVRLENRGLPHSFLEPVVVREDADLASKERVVLMIVGSILPYLLIIFALLGGIYPSIDLGAGEKERNTLETLLLAPVGRTEIAIGKFLVILLTSLVASLLGVVSLYLSYAYLMPSSIVEMLDIRISPVSMVLASSLVLAPAASFAGLLLAISVFARSFKEAQNYLAPLQFAIILPAMASMIPGIEINTGLSLVPLLNVSLLMREILKGDFNLTYYLLTMGSSILLAMLCLAFCVFQFRRETVLFRS